MNEPTGTTTRTTRPLKVRARLWYLGGIDLVVVVGPRCLRNQYKLRCNTDHLGVLGLARSGRSRATNLQIKDPTWWKRGMLDDLPRNGCIKVNIVLDYLNVAEASLNAGGR